MRKKDFFKEKNSCVLFNYTCTYVSYQAFHPLKLDHNASNKTFVVRIFTLSSCFSITGKMFVQFSKPAFGSLLQFPKHFLCQLTRSSASKIPPMVFMARNVKSVQPGRGRCEVSVMRIVRISVIKIQTITYGIVWSTLFSCVKSVFFVMYAPKAIIEFESVKIFQNKHVSVLVLKVQT